MPTLIRQMTSSLQSTYPTASRMEEWHRSTVVLGGGRCRSRFESR